MFFKKYFKYFFSYQLSTILYLIQNIVIVRILIPEEFGRYTYYFSIISTIQMIFLGISSDNSIIITNNNKTNFKSLFFNDVLFSSSIIILLLCLNSFFNFSLELLFFSFSILFHSGFSYIKNCFVDKEKINQRIIFEISSAFFSVLTFLILAIILGFNGLILATIINSLFKNLLGHLLLKINPFEGAYFYKDSIVVNIYKSGLKNSLMYFSKQIDILVYPIFFIGNFEMLAIYKVSKSLYNLTSKFSYPILQIKLIDLKEHLNSNSNKRVTKILFKPLIIIIIFNLFVLFCFLFKGETIISFIYGSQYIGANYYFLYILSFGLLYHSSEFLTTYSFAITNMNSVLIKSYAIFSVAFLTLLLLDIKLVTSFSLTILTVTVYNFILLYSLTPLNEKKD